MDDKIELLLELYKSQIARSEHYENQRAVVSNLVLTISAALIALTSFDGKFSFSDIIAGVLVIVVGLFGYIASRMHSRRARRHGKTAAEFRKEIDNLIPDVEIKKIRDRIDDKYKKNTYLFKIWNGLNIVIVFIGILFIILSIIGFEI